MATSSRTILLALALLALALATVTTPALTGEPDTAETVATGSVGEGGPACQLVHRVEGEAKRRVVLRNVRSSLCPNTGAVALLVVNGEPRVHGLLTEAGTSIHVAAGPGDRVIAIVHMIPLHNGIECVRLGELHLALEVRAP